MNLNKKTVWWLNTLVFAGLGLFVFSIFSSKTLAQDATDKKESPITLLGGDTPLSKVVLDVSKDTGTIFAEIKKTVVSAQTNGSDCKNSYQNSLLNYGRVGLSLSALSSSSTFIVSQSNNELAKSLNDKVGDLKQKVIELENTHQRFSSEGSCKNKDPKLLNKAEESVRLGIQDVSKSLIELEKAPRNDLNLK